MGDVEGVEALMDRVVASGGQLAAEAIHGLIFAHAKRGEVERAQELIQQSVEGGASLALLSIISIYSKQPFN